MTPLTKPGSKPGSRRPSTSQTRKADEYVLQSSARFHVISFSSLKSNDNLIIFFRNSRNSLPSFADSPESPDRPVSFHSVVDDDSAGRENFANGTLETFSVESPVASPSSPDRMAEEISTAKPVLHFRKINCLFILLFPQNCNHRPISYPNHSSCPLSIDWPPQRRQLSSPQFNGNFGRLDLIRVGLDLID
jgi:hypothetical protein